MENVARKCKKFLLRTDYWNCVSVWERTLIREDGYAREEKFFVISHCHGRHADFELGDILRLHRIEEEYDPGAPTYEDKEFVGIEYRPEEPEMEVVEVYWARVEAMEMWIEHVQEDSRDLTLLRIINHTGPLPPTVIDDQAIVDCQNYAMLGLPDQKFTAKFGRIIETIRVCYFF
jgi:hypothetical protein